MNHLEVIHRSFSTKLVGLTVLIIILSTVLSAGFFYFTASRSIGESYEQKITTLSFYKTEAIRQSAFIFLGFSLIAALGIMVAGVFYTHKIVGPLVRTRMVARQLADGKFDVDVTFRSGDMIQGMADSLNHFARTYDARYQLVRNGIGEMHRDALALRGLIEAGDMEGAAAIRAKMAKRMQEINHMLGGVKI